MTVMNIPQLVRQLVKLGFQPSAVEYRRNGLTARFDSRWLTIQTQAAHVDAANGEASGRPGLWKNVRDPSGRPRARVRPATGYRDATRKSGTTKRAMHSARWTR